MVRHGKVGCQVFLVNTYRFGSQLLRCFGQGLARPEDPAHALQGPEQVYRGRAGTGQFIHRPLNLAMPIVSTGMACRQGNSVGGTDTNSGRPPNHHIGNTLSHAGSALRGNPVLLPRQQSLVQQLKPVAMPAHGYSAHGTGGRGIGHKQLRRGGVKKTQYSFFLPRLYLHWPGGRGSSVAAGWLYFRVEFSGTINRANS